MPDHQTSNGKIDKSPGTDYSWIKNVPPSDVGFKSSLDRAPASLIREVLNDLKPDAIGEKTRRKVLEARLRKLEKNQPREIQTPIAPIAAESEVVAIETARLMPSPFEPQAHRRELFTDEYLEELGTSILEKGLIHPIIVRPDFPNFEIIVGEGRWLASKRKGLKTIDCFIRAASDSAAIEMQYEENHLRRGNTPMIDALYFKNLKERFGYSEKEVADRLNTTKENVVDKLKLNDLIPEAVRQLNNKSLPLKHAVYMAKFPVETQKEIDREAYAYKYYNNSEKAVSFDEFKAEVEENISRRLKTAPFNIGDPRLHIKNLICVECPEQTGKQNSLFPDHAGGDARCLNPACFRLKTDTHLKLKREEIAEQRTTDNGQRAMHSEAVKSVPLVTEKSYAPERSPFGNEKVLTNVQPLPEPECEFSELGLAVGGEMKGKQIYLCRNDDCEIHNPKPPQAEKTIDEKAVSGRVRFEVFKEAIKWFDDYKAFWQFDDLIQVLIVKSLMATINSPSAEQIRRIVKDWKDAPPHFINKTLVQKFVAGLDKTQQSQILFLLTYENELYSFHSDSQNNDEIRVIAAGYTKLDYDRLTEEIRETLE